MNDMRRAPAAGMALALLLVCVESASAFPTCTFDPGTKRQTVTQTGTTQLTIATKLSGEIDAGDADGSVPCGTTTTIDVLDVTASGPLFLSLGVPLAPGATPEGIGTSEIEVLVSTTRALHINVPHSTPATWSGGIVGGNRTFEISGDGDVDDLVVRTANTYLSLTTTPFNDVISLDGSGVGGDPIGVQSSRVYALAGEDRLTGPGEFISGPGNDVVISRPGGVIIGTEDTSPLRMLPSLLGTEPGGDGSGSTDTYENFAASTITTYGTQFDDVIYGGPFDDTLRGGGAGDRIASGSGRDFLDGGQGSDTLDGGPNDDRVHAGTATGGPPDSLTGGSGADMIFGSEAADHVVARDATTDTIACAGGVDTGTTDRVDSRTGCEFGPATASITSASASEGSAGVTFKLTLSEAVPEGATTVDVLTSSGTATSGTDFNGDTRRATFAPGATTTTVTVPIIGDVTDEADETFGVSLANPSPEIGAGSAGATGTIVDDHPPPAVSIRGATAAEGAAANVELVLDRATLSDRSVAVATATGSAGAEDFTAVSRRVTIPAGQTTATVAVATTQDTTAEDIESLTITISDPSPGVGLGTTTSATVSITDDDLGTLTLEGPAGSVVEGDEGMREVPLTVRLGAAAERTVRVKVTATAGTADAQDFSGVEPAEVVFAAGATSAAVRAIVMGDRGYEPAESFAVALSDPTGATLGDPGQVTIRIADDDRPPAPALSGPSTVAHRGSYDATESGVLPNARLQCSLRVAGGTAPAFGNCPSGLVFPRLTAGSYVLAARQVDGEGRVSAAVERAFQVVNPPLTCSRIPLVLIEITRTSGGRVRVSGLADLRRFPGRTVEVRTDVGTFGRAVVGEDGLFTVTARLKGATRFAARLPSGERSAQLRIDRRMRIVRRTPTSAGDRVTFRINSPRPPAKVAIMRQTGCSASVRIATVKISRRTRRGTVVLPRPASGDPIALYRIVANFRGGRTYTLPIAIRR